MFQIQNTLVSEEILEEAFVCDLNACKGACCVLGDAGAPLEQDELIRIEDSLDAVKPYLNANSLKTLEELGPFEKDVDGEFVTTLNDGKECVFTIFDEDGKASCGIEQAHLDGKTDFQKPISCHLYPIRVNRLKHYDALNYHRWEICSAACELGKSLKVKVFQFLKTPLIKKYGQEWFNELEEVEGLLNQRNH